jgi:predicted metal-binding protein
MAKIGILTCSNTTQDVGCSSFLCLKGINEGEGVFGRYQSKGGKAELAGIINCAGCPTAVAPGKLLDRVRTLTLLGVEAIHFSSCLMALCPFKNKYLKMLQENFPDIEFIEGTHGSGSQEEIEMFRQAMASLLTQPHQTLADFSKQVGLLP